MPSPQDPATRTLRDEDLVSERRLPRPSVAREALERAITREAVRARCDRLELARAEPEPALDELDPPLAAQERASILPGGAERSGMRSPDTRDGKRRPVGTMRAPATE